MLRLFILFFISRLISNSKEIYCYQCHSEESKEINSEFKNSLCYQNKDIYLKACHSPCFEFSRNIAEIILISFNSINMFFFDILYFNFEHRKSSFTSELNVFNWLYYDLYKLSEERAGREIGTSVWQTFSRNAAGMSSWAGSRSRNS